MKKEIIIVIVIIIAIIILNNTTNRYTKSSFSYIENQLDEIRQIAMNLNEEKEKGGVEKSENGKTEQQDELSKKIEFMENEWEKINKKTNEHTNEILIPFIIFPNPLITYFLLLYLYSIIGMFMTFNIYIISNPPYKLYTFVYPSFLIIIYTFLLLPPYWQYITISWFFFVISFSTLLIISYSGMFMAPAKCPS